MAQVTVTVAETQAAGHAQGAFTGQSTAGWLAPGAAVPGALLPVAAPAAPIGSG